MHLRCGLPLREICGRSADQSLRKAELCTQLTLAARHPALIGFVVVAGQVQQPVQDEHLDLRRERVALHGGLARCPGHTDGQIAGHSFRAHAISGK